MSIQLVVSMRYAWAVALAASDARVWRRAVVVADIWRIVAEIVVVALCLVVVVVVCVVVVVGVVVVIGVVVVAAVVVVAVVIVVVGVEGTSLCVELVLVVAILGSVGLGANLAPRRFHAFLSLAIFASSSKVFVAGTSSNMLPGRLFENCTFAAIFTSLLSSIRSMWPSQTKRRCLTAATRS